MILYIRLLLFVSLYKLYFHTSSLYKLYFQTTSSKQNRDMQLTMFNEKTRENAHLTNLRQSTYTITQTLHGKIARSLICNLRSKSFRHVVIRASVFHNSKGMKLSHSAILLRPSLWSFDKVWETKNISFMFMISPFRLHETNFFSKSCI